MFNSLTIGAGTGGLASRLLAWGLGWEDSGALANIITGIPHVVHTPTQAWKVVQVSLTPRVVHGVFIPKVVNDSFIPRYVRNEAISKVVFSEIAGKVVKDSRVSRVQMSSSPAAKAVMGSGVRKVRHGSPVFMAVTQAGTGKVVR